MHEIAFSNTLDIFQVESLKYILSFSKCLLGDKKGAQVYHWRKSTGAQKVEAQTSGAQPSYNRYKPPSLKSSLQNS